MESMDRPVSTSDQVRRRLRRLIWPLIGTLLLAALVVLVVGWLKPSVRRDRIRTAQVKQGEMTATLDATGLVVPEFDEVLTAPLATRVIAVCKTAGSAVAPGDTIVVLEDRGPRRDVARLQEQITLKETARRQVDLDLARDRADLASQRSIKELELASLRYEVSRNRELFDLGLVSYDQVRKSETDSARATIELAHLQTRLANAEQDRDAALATLEGEMAILATDLEQAREQLARTVVRSVREGIVTWVVPSEGVAVTTGEAVARIADLSAFRVDATLPDVQARRLVVGLPATVRSGDTRLTGRVHKILPTVSNGIVTFEVALDDADHPVLRPNLRVDVHAVTDRREQTLYLKRGPLLRVDGAETVFVVHGDRAVRTPVEIGLTSFEHYEILSGLDAGDEVIISDMSDYRKMQEVELR